MGASKVKCGPATKLQPRLPHGLHCQLSSNSVPTQGGGGGQGLHLGAPRGLAGTHAGVPPWPCDTGLVWCEQGPGARKVQSTRGSNHVAFSSIGLPVCEQGRAAAAGKNVLWKIEAGIGQKQACIVRGGGAGVLPRV